MVAKGKITKEYLIMQLDAIIGVRETHFDGDWINIELGIPWNNVSDAIEEKPELFKDEEVKEWLKKAVKATEELVANNSDFYERLEETFCPVRDLFPDREKHYWWYIPEKILNENELKEWKEYLKKYNYNDPC